MSKYQITLKTVDKFFFGGDMTFQVGNNEKDEFNSQFSSYIIRSMMFPQQTSLLGMLRFLVLRNAGDEVFKDNRIADKVKATELIGLGSFQVNKDHTENIFGVIKSIGHVKVRKIEKDKPTTDLEFAPFYGEIDFAGCTSGYINGKEIQVPNLTKEQYDAKKGLKTLLTDGKKEYSLDDIFIEDRRIGIARDIKTGKTEDDALFKQISYRFNNKDGKEYCFAFEAEIDDNVPFATYNGQLVSVGGDNSQFIIGIKKKDAEPTVAKPIKNAVNLLSPTLLSRDEAQTAKYAITQEPVTFRFLQSSVANTSNYHILSKQVRRSQRKYELYSAGSIFYFDDEQQANEFAKLIENKKEFRQIGYNQYIK